MSESHLRAADADRMAVATALGDHMSAGRLTLAEYDERVAHAYAAHTFGELAELTADLPAIGDHPVAAQAPARRPEARPACGPATYGRSNQAWHAWLRTALMVTTIWLIISLSSGGPIYFWPMWVIGPWGAVLLAQRLGRGRHPARNGTTGPWTGPPGGTDDGVTRMPAGHPGHARQESPACGRTGRRARGDRSCSCRHRAPPRHDAYRI